MGLDFNKSSANWSYTGFMRFRERLAKEIGLKLAEMKGFTAAGKPWTAVNDPIVPFLNHSDCDGHLTARQMKQIGPRLLELIKSWPDDDYDKQQATILAKDMVRLAKRGVRLEFC